MSKIFIADTYYDAFLRTLPPMPGTYAEELAKLLERGFGTADFFSRNLKPLGWETCDVVANYEPLQRIWAREAFMGPVTLPHIVTLAQIEAFKPDVVFMQDLSYFSESETARLAQRYVLAGQCSCPMPDPKKLRHYDCIMTSFPHYVPAFRKLGVQAEYLPLAFEPAMLGKPKERLLDIAFVGGVGRNSHWNAGTELMETLAHTFGRRFAWYGYGMENLPSNSPLRKAWRGFAWGRSMYDVYARSKIVVNRHGEVAQGYANNLRLYEATGMGALLVTEATPNLAELFPSGSVVTYARQDELMEKLLFYLGDDEERESIAALGQAHTLAHHTYAQRMARVSDVLMTCLERKKVTA